MPDGAAPHGSVTDSATKSSPAAARNAPAQKAPAGTVSGPRAQTPPEPVWPPEPPVAPNLVTTLEPLREVEPKPIPDWERAWWSEDRWEHASETTLPSRPLPSVDHRQRPPQRSLSVTTTIVLASLFVVFVAVAAILASLHHSAPPSTGRASTPTSTVSSADVTRLRTATTAAVAATATAHSGLESLSGIPTLARVAAVINPYVQSLQHYGSVLAETAAPTTARTAAASAHALVTQEVQFLGTINGLQSIGLGSYLDQVGQYLDQFGQDSTQLQRTLSSAERGLHASHA